MKKVMFVLGYMLLIVSFVFAQPAPKKQPPFQKGMELYKNGEYDAAIASFKKVVNVPDKVDATGAKIVDPKKAEAHFWIGMCYRKKAEPDQAEVHFTKAIELRPTHLQSRKERADLYIEQKKWAQAVPDLQKVLEVEPDNLQANFQLGQAFAWQENFSAAIPPLKKVVELNPQHAYGHYWLGMSYYKIKDYGRMIEHFEIFIKLAPNAPEAPQVKEILAQVGG